MNNTSIPEDITPEFMVIGCDHSLVLEAPSTACTLQKY